MRKLKSLLLLSIIGFVACETSNTNEDDLAVSLSDTVAAEVAFEETEDRLITFESFFKSTTNLPPV